MGVRNAFHKMQEIQLVNKNALQSVYKTNGCKNQSKKIKINRKQAA